MKYFFILYRYNIKYLVNQILYSSNKFGLKGSFLEKDTIKKAYKSVMKIIITIYIFWILIMSLSQLFFSNISLEVREVNFLILSFLGLSMFLFLGYRVNMDFNRYFLDSSLSRDIRKKLILKNEVLGILFVYSFILLGALPFIILQPILNGITGIFFMTKFLITILGFGLLISFVKIMHDMFMFIRRSQSKSVLSQLVILLLSVLIVIYEGKIAQVIIQIPDIIINNKLPKMVLNIIPDSINLYMYVPPTGISMIVIITILFLYLFVNRIILNTIKNSNESSFKLGLLGKSSKKKKRKLLSPYMLFLKSYNREFNIFNMQFVLIIFFITLASSLLDGNNVLVISNLSILASTLLVLFLLQKNSINVNFFYYYKVSKYKSIILLLIPCIIQFSLLSILFYLVLDAEWSYVFAFILIGLLNIVAGLLIGLQINYSLLRSLQGNIINKIVKLCIIAYLFINISLTRIVATFIENLLVPYLVTVILALIINNVILKNINKIKVFIYAIYKKIIPAS